MLIQIKDLPENVIGLRAQGTLTKNDYENTVMPLFDKQYQKGNKIRFLYQLGPDFEGFTAGAAWEDFRVGTKYLRLFESCAVVSDIDWIRHATHFMSSLLPCPVKVFANADYKKAVAWLQEASMKSHLSYDLSSDGVLVLQPTGPLEREDFNALSSLVDPWIEAHKKLQGVVICTEKFPGWENFGSFIRHIEFVSGHHRKVRKVALALDGALPEFISKVASHFVEAEIKQFPFAEKNRAIEWAKSEQ